MSTQFYKIGSGITSPESHNIQKIGSYEADQIHGINPQMIYTEAGDSYIFWGEDTPHVIKTLKRDGNYHFDLFLSAGEARREAINRGYGQPTPAHQIQPEDKAQLVAHFFPSETPETLGNNLMWHYNNVGDQDPESVLIFRFFYLTI